MIGLPKMFLVSVLESKILCHMCLGHNMRRQESAAVHTCNRGLINAKDIHETSTRHGHLLISISVHSCGIGKNEMYDKQNDREKKLAKTVRLSKA